MVEYDTKEKAVDYIKSELMPLCGDDSIADAIADAYAKCFETEVEPDPDSRLVITAWKWVIRDDDLKLFDALTKAISAAASLNFFVDKSITVGFVTTIIITVVSLFYNVARKGAKLSEEQCSVLVALKAFDIPVSANELALHMKLPEDSVNELLVSLQKVRLSDGSVVAIATLDGNGFWQAAGV